MLRKTLIFLTLFILGFRIQSTATHIVGGDFYYKFLGNNRYEVTLKLYVDCENGNPQAISSDIIAIVGEFNASTNRLVSKHNFSRTGPVRLNKSYYKCLIPPKDVCVDEYTYKKILTITPGREGKILAFQRCCRNNSINNIIIPESTGATYWCKIPGTKTTLKNSSAVFKELPPNYLCKDAPLTFDHSAIDPDGDSLIYEFYIPYQGATRDIPRPTTPSNPPFSRIFWKAPFNVLNQISGAPNLKIDRFTGEVTITPDKIGQFVIGIKVLEYRNGILINETLRDYQMNVKNCRFDLVAAFFVPTYSCTKKVVFSNKSYKAQSYSWDFGDPNVTTDVSTDENPTYTYPKDGDYTVVLKVENSVCKDEYKFVVKIRSNIKVNLGPDIILCDRVNQYLSAKIFNADKVEWNNGKFGPVIRARKAGKYIAKVFFGQCFGSDTLEIKLDPVKFSIPKDSLFCDSVLATLNAGIANHKYLWNTSPADTFQTLDVNKPGTYWVKVSNKHCSKIDSIRLFLPTDLKLRSHLFVCNEFDIEFDPGFVPEGKYLWNDGSTNQVNTISTGGWHWVKVSQRYCKSIDSLFIENPVIPLDLGNDTNYCDSFKRTLVAPEFMKSILWYDGTTTRFNNIDKAGKYFVYMEDTNGCNKSDTINISLSKSPKVNLAEDTISICLRMTEVLDPGKYYSYKWSTGDKSRKIEVSDEGWYIVKVIDEVGCWATDSTYIKIDINALPNDLYIPNAFTPNKDNLNELFPFQENIEQPEYRIRIYSRWGEKVFDSDNQENQNWDAYFNGLIVQPDAFVYIVEYRGCDGDNRRSSGTINILR